MVQSNYTVSTAQQLLRRSPHNGRGHVNITSQPSRNRRGPVPTKPLPPTPLNTVRIRASRSSGVLAVTDNVKIRTDIPTVATVPEDEVITLPASVYTPTIPRAKKSEKTTLASPSPASNLPAIDPPTFKTNASSSSSPSPELRQRISQYYEYITPPISLATIGIGRTDSRRERKASHTPTSSAGSEIYFSPIDASRSQVFLSSPQPSPPISPLGDVSLKDQDGGGEQARLGEVLVRRVAELEVGCADARVEEPEAVELAGVRSKVTLTLAQVDRITTALAKAPLVQRRVRRSHLDELQENTTTSMSNNASSDNHATTATTTGLPTPPPSEASVSNEIEVEASSGGIALLSTTISGAPVSLASTDAFTPGRCTHLSLPYGLSTTSNLRIEPAAIANAESKIFLQTLIATLYRKTNLRSESTLLAETDITMSFTRAALTELATAQNMTLHDIEIRTPIASAPTTTTAYSPEGSESIDWAAFGQEEEEDASAPPAAATRSLPITSNDNVLDSTLSTLASTTAFSAETCTVQTLTLLSELSRLQTAHATFLILQPTRYDANGELAGVKIPLVSTKLKEQFERMGAAPSVAAAAAASNHSSSGGNPAAVASSSHGGLKGRLFREAVIAAVAPRFGEGEEFETVVVLDGGNVRMRARCVPLFDGTAGADVVERWVCFLGE